MTGGHLCITQVHVERRNECALYHRGQPPCQAALRPMIVGEPWKRIGIDITGSRPRSSNGYEYILTVMDHFSRWSEAYPLRDHGAPTVARLLIDQLFSRFGHPGQILSDQGKEFDGQLIHELCKWMEIDKIRTSLYHSALNGMVERFHRTLNFMLAKFVTENQRDWDTKVPLVMAAYRTFIHDTTGHTPNFFMSGREVRAPLDVVLGESKEEQRW